jgi:hypothetical protein
MEVTVTVINPLDSEEIEVTLNLNVMVSLSNGTKVINVNAFGAKELP